MLKKWFFDMWDSILRLLALNAVFLVLVAIPFTLPGYLSELGLSNMLTVLIFGVGIVVLILYFGGLIHVSHLSAEFTHWGLKDLFFGIKKRLWPTLFFTGSNALVYLFMRNAVPFYLSWENLWGFTAFAVLFWVGLLWLISIQFFLPLSCQMRDPVFKTLKKCFLVSLDNIGFSFILLMLIAIFVIISELTAFMFPGMFGVLLLSQGGTKLRLKKYDFLEQHPDTPKSGIPWRALLNEERQKVGRRTLKSMFFPWKD